MRASQIIGKGRREFKERTRLARTTTLLHSNAVGKVVVACGVSEGSLCDWQLEVKPDCSLD